MLEDQVNAWKDKLGAEAEPRATFHDSPKKTRGQGCYTCRLQWTIPYHFRGHSGRIHKTRNSPLVRGYGDTYAAAMRDAVSQQEAYDAEFRRKHAENFALAEFVEKLLED